MSNEENHMMLIVSQPNSLIEKVQTRLDKRIKRYPYLAYEDARAKDFWCLRYTTWIAMYNERDRH
jgi:hypothetical protein